MQKNGRTFAKRIESIGNVVLGLCLIIVAYSCSPECYVETLHTYIDIGDYNLSNESLNLLPYRDKRKITFKDSLENKIDFFIEEKQINKSSCSLLYNYDVHVEGDTVRYKYANESKKYVIKNDFLNLEFNLRLIASPYRSDPESEKIADVLTICRKSLVDETICNGVFYQVLKQRTWPEVTEIELLNSVTFLKKEFNEVFYSKDDIKGRLYYNNEFGIIAFKDADEKLWRFEKLE